MFFSSQGLWYGESEISKPGDNTCIHACGVFCVCVCARAFVEVSFFFSFLFSLFSLLKSSFLKWIQIFILWVSELRVTSDAFQTIRESLSEQQVAKTPRRTNVCGRRDTYLPLLSLSLSVSYCDCLSCNHTHRIKLNTPSFLFFLGASITFSEFRLRIKSLRPNIQDAHSLEEDPRVSDL